MWLQRWLGNVFSRLYTRFGRDTFTLAEVTRIAGSDGSARVAVSQLRKAGLIYVFSAAERKKQYIVGDPVFLPYLATGRLSNLHLVKQSRYARLLGLFTVDAIETSPTIKSTVLYGSVSRGVAKEDSDVDLFVLMDSSTSVGERIEQLSQVEDSGRAAKELDWLDARGIQTHISILPLTREEGMHFPPIMLDILEDGIPIFDDGTYQDLRSTLRSRLVEARAKREFLSPNEWYWDMAPRLTTGEVYAV